MIKDFPKVTFCMVDCQTGQTIIFSHFFISNHGNIICYNICYMCNIVLYDDFVLIL